MQTHSSVNPGEKGEVKLAWAQSRSGLTPRRGVPPKQISRQIFCDLTNSTCSSSVEYTSTEKSTRVSYWYFSLGPLQLAFLTKFAQFARAVSNHRKKKKREKWKDQLWNFYFQFPSKTETRRWQPCYCTMIQTLITPGVPWLSGFLPPPPPTKASVAHFHELCTCCACSVCNYLAQCVSAAFAIRMANCLKVASTFSRFKIWQII